MADTVIQEHQEADSGGTALVIDDACTDQDGEIDADVAVVSGSNANYDSSGGSGGTDSKLLAQSPLRCDRCDFEGVSKQSLETHVKKVHKIKIEDEDMEVQADNNNPPADRIHRKMFECDVCNMKFSNGANMRRHKMRHTGVKPYECRVCEKRFFRKDHLAEHFTTHTKTLPYHCPICNRGFQRQIAMRAHFQNEHVGQHDMVKSCPLCSYRASSMKSLRIHFFNRHGIDLDNPGPAGASASLIAAAAQQGFQLDNAQLTSLGNLSGSLSVSMTTSTTPSASATAAANFSDSGDSTGARSTDNATPPMHFLTPHVEISMADAPGPVYSPSLCDQASLSNSAACGDNDSSAARMLNGGGGGPGSPQSADSNSNTPSSTHQHQLLVAAAAAAAAATASSLSGGNASNSTSSYLQNFGLKPCENSNGATTVRLSASGNSTSVVAAASSDTNSSTDGAANTTTSTANITPSISLIPIKQEPMDDYESSGAGSGGSGGSGVNKSKINMTTSGGGIVQLQSATSSNISSIIKVSPLKSLLREDLKRKIITRSTTTNSSGMLHSRGRSSTSPSNGALVITGSSSPGNLTAVVSASGVGTNVDSSGHANGTITSTGPEHPSDSSTVVGGGWRERGKRSAMSVLVGAMQCVFCGIGFPDQTLYFLHKGCHSDANPWKCNICGEQCCNVYEFNSHLLSKSHQ